MIFRMIPPAYPRGASRLVKKILKYVNGWRMKNPLLTHCAVAKIKIKGIDSI